MRDRKSKDRVRGCLLAGAVGDALGAAIEFDSLAGIRAKHGSAGLTDYAPAYGRLGAITDDTQMLLFTAEGLLLALKNGNPIPKTVHQAYLRWLHTQGAPWDKRTMGERRGLVELAELHASRAPGTTCTSALQSGRMGTIARPLNDSKGCGGIMRVAPVGLVDLPDPFQLGCELAAITHGHPSGYLPAGFMGSSSPIWSVAWICCRPSTVARNGWRGSPITTRPPRRFTRR